MMSIKYGEALDVWLLIEEGEEEEATCEANTYLTEYGYAVEWYLNSVGLVTTVHFDTLAEAHNWYETNGYEDYTA